MKNNQPKRTIWQRICAIAKAIRKDIKVFLAVYEFFAYIGLLLFVFAAIGLTLKNEPLRLNDAGLLALTLCGLGVLVSFLYGYWEHLLKRDEEWER